MLISHLGSKFEGEPGVYYSESTDKIVILSNKKFEMFRRGFEVFSCYVYDFETEGFTFQNSTVNDDLKLVYLGEL